MSNKVYNKEKCPSQCDLQGLVDDRKSVFIEVCVRAKEQFLVD